MTYRHPDHCNHEPYVCLYPDGRKQCPWCGRKSIGSVILVGSAAELETIFTPQPTK